MLSARLLERNRKRLIEERARLIEELADTAALERGGTGLSNHMADEATEAFEQAKALALRQNLERTLQAIEAALNKMDRGTYGICENCGQPIDPARLKAKPDAALCLDCRQRLEKRR